MELLLRIVFSLLAFGLIVPVAIFGAESCVDCHKQFSGSLVGAWQKSVHAAKGVGCIECHGDNHSKIFEVKGIVSAAVCAKCHEKEVKEFDQSLHALAMDQMKLDPRFEALSEPMREMSCVSCHQIGMRFSDGSKGKCNSCHSGHSFSAAEARQPEACAQCHTGPDHPQIEMWQLSKHGQLYAAPETRAQSATCVTCHMPQGTHNTSIGLTYGNVANGAVAATAHGSVKMRTLSEPALDEGRAAMLKTCLPCHSSRFASESLIAADAVKKEADTLIFEAADLVKELRKEGLLTSSQVLPDFDSPAAVEQRLFNMIKFSHASTFKGAYHQSPVHTYTKGFVALKQDAHFIKEEAQRLRKNKTP